MTIQVEEYQASTGGNDARRSNMFSRTNGFSFSDPCNGYLQTSTATTDKLGIRVGRVRSTGHEIDLTELNHATVLLPARGELQARSRRAEHSCGQDGFCVIVISRGMRRILTGGPGVLPGRPARCGGVAIQQQC